MEEWAGDIASAFDLGGAATLVGPVDRGELGEVWLLRTSTGRYAVKVPFEPIDPGVLAEPAAFADAVADAGVATARFHRTVADDLVVSVGGQHVLVLDWLDLAPPDSRLDPYAVGRLLASLHGVPFTGARERDPWFFEPVGEEGWAELVDHSTRAGAPFAPALAGHLPELMALEDLLDPLPADRTCHRDLWSDNVRATRSGHLCLFDWDNCGPANQSEEVAQVLFDFGEGERARHRALHTAYLEADGPAPVLDVSAFSMVIAVLGHIGRYDVRGWLDAEPGGPERRRREDRVVEFLGLHPHRRFDRRTIESILADLR